MKSSVGHGVKSATRRRRVCAQLVEELERRVLLAADVRFGVIGDFSSDLGTGPEQAVSNLVKSWSPQFVVTVGDNNYPNGGADTIDANIGQFYHQYIYPYTGTYGAGSSDSVNHFFPALGNHDWNTSGAAPYLSYFTLPGNERYYDLQQGNVGIFVVDSDPSEPDGNTSGSTQGKWLQSELAKSTAQWKFVFFHHPAYSSGGIGSNTWMQWPFAQWGATAVFQGHDHDYERLTENGIPYFVDGLGGETITGFASPITGSQVRYAGDYGAMLVDASSTSVTFTFTTRTGQLIDSYTIGSPTPPAAPSNLTASALSDSQVKLTWTDNSTNESGFKIERSPDGINFTQITTVAAGTTTYTDSSLSGSTTYYYRLRATNSAGDSAYCNVASATTQTTVPLIAAGSTWKYLDNGTNQGTAWRSISFNDTAWKSGPAVLGYGDSASEATIVSYGSNSGAKFVTTYFRKSISVSNPSSISALNLKLLRDDGAIVYLNGTEVFRSNMPTGTISYTTLASSEVQGSAALAWYTASLNPSLLVAGTNVIAVELHQFSKKGPDINFDLQLSGAAPSAVPAPPTNLAALPVSATQIALSWTDNATNETGFKVERSSDGVSFTQIGTTAANITAYSDATVSGAAIYYYRVKATNASGDSAYSNVASSAPLTPPAAPTNLTASVVSSTQVNLAWKINSTNESGFEVDRSADNLNWGLLIVTEDGVSTYSDTAVSGGATYYYRVRAVNPAGDSGWTSTATAVVPAASQIVYLSDINWASATNGWGPVEKDMSVGGPNSGDGRTITLNGITYSKGLGTNAISQIVYNLGGAYSSFLSDVGIDDEETVNGTVDFQVLADGVKIFDSGTMTATSTTQSFNLNVTGVQQLTLICGDAGDGPDYDHGDWAGARLVLAPAPVAPIAPSNLSAVAMSSTQVNLTWTDNSANESGFKIERSTDNVTFTQIATAGVNASSYVDATAQPSTLYYYRVKATNAAGDSSPSNIANATTLAATTAVTYLSDLTWASATVGWGTIQKDLSIKGNPITLRGTVYAKGIGTHAASTIVYNLNGAYSSFLVDVGIDDEVNGQGSVDFQVLADGNLLFDSGALLGTDPVFSLDLPMTGVKQLTLIADNGIPNNIDFDHADWAGARLVAAGSATTTKTTSAASPFNTTTPITSFNTSTSGSTTTSASSLLTSDQTTSPTTSFTSSSTMTVTSGK